MTYNTNREIIMQFFTGGNAERHGLWLGQPHPDTVKLYTSYFNVSNFEDIREKYNDDCRWFMGETCYKHPEGEPIFEFFEDPFRATDGKHPLTDCDSIFDVEKYDWPNPDFLDFTNLKRILESKNQYFKLSGMWSPFFHIVMDLFGMQEYFIKMYTNPKVVEAVTTHVVDFYLEANRRFFEECSQYIDAFFFGNDFGTQENIMVSPEMFKKFVLPYFVQLVNLAKSYNLPVMLHSCGAISRVIPFLIESGVDALHPLQAGAKGMEAEVLAKEFKGEVTFVGGVDTQDLLVNASPAKVKEKVYTLKELFGSRFIVSPSHEALLPNVPPENMIAMAEAAIN